ncbi:HI1506-related protein [Alkalimonas mucilaginosa]|uniref:HI1506-related protein n=1 Tax=Alkalimonas mucilaginosa TaxID=3057676 RepID=A0ABU7JH76_9GAMM|nr:HI1506-related protein [Alkalimonas sp. MEB004]MEE2025032.1 HI1506-related protein [Alkalimonas sp. MEB004]
MAKLLFIVCAAHTGYRRGGIRFVQGENTVETENLTAEQLQQIHQDPLLVVGEYADSISLQDEANKGSGTQGPVGDGTLSAAVTGLTLEQAFAQLQPDNPDHFTQSNQPQLSALEQLTGRRVTAAERNEAWAAYQAALAIKSEAGDAE